MRHQRYGVHSFDAMRTRPPGARRRSALRRNSASMSRFATCTSYVCSPAPNASAGTSGKLKTMRSKHEAPARGQGFDPPRGLNALPSSSDSPSRVASTPWTTWAPTARMASRRSPTSAYFATSSASVSKDVATSATSPVPVAAPPSRVCLRSPPSFLAAASPAEKAKLPSPTARTLQPGGNSVRRGLGLELSSAEAPTAIGALCGKRLT
mmetsp:Transcript_31776/g.87796  ORF Transcript_31776/g.87796 Transcript_31776/m.87796 type:complete len:209 (-) Transcript_31776:24-650(-)